jgi:hypothetical protein
MNKKAKEFEEERKDARQNKIGVLQDPHSY